MKEQLTIKQVDGKDIATLTVHIELGEVHVPSSEVRVFDGKKVQTFLAPVHVAPMLRFYEQVIKESVNQDQEDRFQAAIQIYVQLHLLNQLGVTETPLQYVDESKQRIKGLPEAMPVVFE